MPQTLNGAGNPETAFNATGTPVGWTPLAVVGLGAIFAQSPDVRTLWAHITNGSDLFEDVPPQYWLTEDYYDPRPDAQDKTYSKRGAFVRNVDFDPLRFGMPPASLSSTDSAQLISLVVAQQVLDDARDAFGQVNRDRVSVILGCTGGLKLVGEMAARVQRPVWIKSLRECGVPESKAEEVCDKILSHYPEWRETTFPGLLGNVIAGRIAAHFDFGGTNCTTDAACASAASALWLASAELCLGRADLVITGGVDATNDPLTYMCFSKTPALSPTGDCRPFDESADGTVMGEGFGMFALRRLTDAERDGNRIYAVLKGMGTSSDGRSKSIYAPRAAGQEKALYRAYESAGYEPATVELMEAHGTGTSAGDAAEVEALTRVFASESEKASWCALGSVKSQLGHTKSAAAAAGVLKAVLALHHKTLPPTCKVTQPHKELHLDRSPFYLNVHSRPWIRAADHPRRASVSAFGFGGTNFHMTFEEYGGPRSNSPRLRDLPTELVLFCGADRAELIRVCLEQVAKQSTAGSIAHVARESQRRFVRSKARLAVVAANEADLEQKLRRAIATLESVRSESFSIPPGIEFSEDETEPGGLAVVFPGQGSQYVGMGADIAMHFDAARSVWDEEASLPVSGAEALHKVVFPPAAFGEEPRLKQVERLRNTAWAQPALGAMSVSLWRLLQQLWLKPDCFGGHSFGDLTALHAAGVLDFTSFLQLARHRGELMARSGAGGMCAVMAEPGEVEQLIRSHSLSVAIANRNSPRQTVISGAIDAIMAAEEGFSGSGYLIHRLDTSAAFHSSLMTNTASGLAAYMEPLTFQPSAIPVFSSATACHYSADSMEIRKALAAAVVSPVLFLDQVEAMLAAGVRTFLEVGPGATLSGLIEAIPGSGRHRAIALDARGQNGVTSFWKALAKLAVAGYPLAFEALWEEFDLGPDPRLTQKSAVPVLIHGHNYERRYPPPGGAADRPLPVAEPPPIPSPPPAARPPVNRVDGAGVEPARRASPPSEHQAGLFDAIRDMQRQIAEAHGTYQKSMAETHMAFLRAAEASSLRLAAMVSGGATHTDEFRDIAMAPSSGQNWQEPVAYEEPVYEQTQAEIMAPPPELSFSGASTNRATPVVPAPVESTVAPNSPEDLENLLLAVIAEKTGYPKSVLKLDMSLETDLGIDSIRRVEIFASFQKQLPDLSNVGMKQIAELGTLRQILSFLSTRLPGTEPERSVPRYRVQPVAALAPGIPLAGLSGLHRLAITQDGRGIAELLANQLRSKGIAAEAVESPFSGQADGLICLEGLRECSGDEDSLALNRRVFHSVQALARSEAQSLLLVTVQDTGGDFGYSGRGGPAVWMAGIGALAKVFGTEFPDAGVKAIDVECAGRSPDEIARILLEELFSGADAIEVGFPKERERLVLTTNLCPAGAAGGIPEIKADSVFVVSGGARGVTAAALYGLARVARPRFALLGRTALDEEPRETRKCATEAEIREVLFASGPASDPRQLASVSGHILAVREIQTNLAALRAAGAEVQYHTVDVRSRDEVRRCLAEVRRTWGPVSGLIHGAGLIADQWIANKTPQQFDDVFDTKILGLRALMAELQNDPLRFMILFSSISATFGNAGQSDYAMANEILNKVAAVEGRRRNGECLVRAVGWGPWDGGMVHSALKTRMTDAGISLISLTEGAAAMLEELSTPSDEYEIVRGDLAAFSNLRRQFASRMAAPV